MAHASDPRFRTALLLEYFTVGYNIAEAAASIVFGTISGSIALVGFGLDSIVEMLSGIALIWRLKKHDAIPDEEENRAERHAQRFVAITFLLLAAYVFFESAEKLITSDVPHPSAAGIAIAVLSILIMPVLAQKKHGIGLAINSKALVADAKETLACAFLSVALLIGLSANYLFAFWQADPLAGIAIGIFLSREGSEGWRKSAGENKNS
jgi:divalent metal cation (Fe/Co/Zn/Cd) transporter